MSAPTSPPIELSPCPHTPKCPPPACLPPTLRDSHLEASAKRDTPTTTLVDSPADKDGFEVRTDSIVSFAQVMDMSATTVDQLKVLVPRFQGWNLAPFSGIPILGLMYVNSLNTIADAWGDCAEILREVLEKDSQKLFKVAENYHAANEQSVAAIKKTDL